FFSLWNICLSGLIRALALYNKKNPAGILQGPSHSTRDRRQRERRNRRKNLWGNVSLLRGWQQHQIKMLLLALSPVNSLLYI
ncbi:hypothetical protein, partial [Bacillus salacetis]|uniref:hypothetical protein n=1 Tax=Bacillus salacetis TaxID=2315464 RepID=UPI00196ABC61